MVQVTANSPLRLEAVHVSKISIVSNDDAFFGGRMCSKDSPDQYSTSADFEVYHSPDEQAAHLVSLDLSLRSKKDAQDARFLSISVRLQGMFFTNPEFAEAIIKQVIPGNCLAMLHGIARGVVLAATSSSQAGGFLLPVVNYHELITKKLKSAKRKAAKATQSPSAEE